MQFLHRRHQFLFRARDSNDVARLFLMHAWRPEAQAGIVLIERPTDHRLLIPLLPTHLIEVVDMAAKELRHGFLAQGAAGKGLRADSGVIGDDGVRDSFHDLAQCLGPDNQVGQPFTPFIQQQVRVNFLPVHPGQALWGGLCVLGPRENRRFTSPSLLLSAPAP